MEEDSVEKAQTAGRQPRTFTLDVTRAPTGRDGFDAFRHSFEAQTGEPWPLPSLDLGKRGGFRIRVRGAVAHDTLISDVHSEHFLGQPTVARESGDRFELHMVRRGSWRFSSPSGRGDDVTVSAGTFIARRNNPPLLFDVRPGTEATVLLLPPDVLGRATGGRPVVGPADSGEMRLLTAHAAMVRETADDLSLVGLRGARDALIELVRAVLRREFDDTEPRLARALARAAMDLADEHLTDPELSPATLARHLNVSVRTLHRAFTTAEESVSAYVRRRRLERARQELLAPLGRPTVSELAARWHFSDSSHFIRAFKKQYGQTPANLTAASEERTRRPPVT
ncbi:helix-turn-helix domain-containing protein [Streptomyces sp. NPDC048324]|uniref:helix-turn-helix domain-containing protein n=1 Tax=Streptomyces sp. NPDC048324 TaxID=3157205 RepID=UPI00341E43ED